MADTAHRFTPGLHDTSERCPKCGRTVGAVLTLGLKCMPLPPARRRALSLLFEQRRNGVRDMTAAAFARLMWPNSKGHTTRARRRATPAGGALGAGIKMTAGAFLWRMEGDGLVEASYRADSSQPLWSISSEGRKVLMATGGLQ